VCWLPPVVFGDGGLLSLKLRRHDHSWQQARCGRLEERQHAEELKDRHR
jgi:hypothetical protein